MAMCLWRSHVAENNSLWFNHSMEYLITLSKRVIRGMALLRSRFRKQVEVKNRARIGFG